MVNPNGTDLTVRRAETRDIPAIGQLLYDFNIEFDEPAPNPSELTRRMRQLLTASETSVLLVGPGPDGLAVLRFRPAIWNDALECHLAELYVAPARRGEGLGRALMQAAIGHARDRGADHMDLGTSEDDVAARTLYESLGFYNRHGGAEGPLTFFYERGLQS